MGPIPDTPSIGQKVYIRWTMVLGGKTNIPVLLKEKAIKPSNHSVINQCLSHPSSERVTLAEDRSKYRNPESASGIKEPVEEKE